MECAFTVGQRVVCVDDEFADNFDMWINAPTKGAIYTVRSVEVMTGANGCVSPIIRLVEIVNPVENWDAGRMEVGFLPRRFRPIVERKTSIEVFKKLLIHSKVEEAV